MACQVDQRSTCLFGLLRSLVGHHLGLRERLGGLAPGSILPLTGIAFTQRWRGVRSQERREGSQPARIASKSARQGTIS